LTLDDAYIRRPKDQGGARLRFVGNVGLRWLTCIPHVWPMTGVRSIVPANGDGVPRNRPNRLMTPTAEFVR